MDEQKITENRLAMIGLAALIAITLAVFLFCFWGAGDLFSDNGETPEVNHSTDGATDGQTTDSEQLSSIIADVQAKMNNFQTQLDSPYLLEVNDETPLPEGYEVGELAGLTGSDSLQLESHAAAKMNEFLAAADKAGYNATVIAAYRTENQQEKAYNDAVQGFMNAGYPAETARSMAAASVGAVNCSEHQLGFAVDFSPKEMTLLGSDGRTFEEFLTENMPKYGFILSYPAGEEEQTGHSANTVHYRYVGVEAAAEMVERQYTLPKYREYLSTQIEVQKQYIDSLKAKGGNS